MSVNPSIVCGYLFLWVSLCACAYARLSHVRNHHGDHVEECIYQSIPSKTSGRCGCVLCLWERVRERGVGENKSAIEWESVKGLFLLSHMLLWWSSLTPLRLANQKPKFRQYYGGTSHCHNHPSICVQTSPNVVQCKDLRNVADKLR